MKLRSFVTILGIVGGLAFAAATASAHCGTCGVGGKKEHACPADCAKECCKDKKKECTEGAKECTDGQKKCAEGCTKECCKGKKKEG